MQALGKISALKEAASFAPLLSDYRKKSKSKIIFYFLKFGI